MKGPMGAVQRVPRSQRRGPTKAPGGPAVPRSPHECTAPAAAVLWSRRLQRHELRARPATTGTPSADVRPASLAARNSMILSQLLNPEAVSVQLAATTKKEAIVELVDLLEKAHGVDSKGEILGGVLKREQMMTTGIGNGIAIPHGKARSV